MAAITDRFLRSFYNSEISSEIFSSLYKKPYLCRIWNIPHRLSHFIFSFSRQIVLLNPIFAKIKRQVEYDFRGHLTVGYLALNQVIGVRISAPEQNFGG